MTNSELNLLAFVLGLGVFAVIVAVGWRSVQNRRILRVQGANGQETIIVANEDDEISNIVTTTQSGPAPAVVLVNADPANTALATEFGRRETGI